MEPVLGVNVMLNILFEAGVDLEKALLRMRTKLDPLEKILIEKGTDGQLKVPIKDGIAMVLEQRISAVANLNFTYHTGRPEEADILILFRLNDNGVSEIGKPSGKYVHPRGSCQDFSYNGLCHNMTLGVYSVPIILHEFMHILGFHHEIIHPDRPFVIKDDAWNTLKRTDYEVSKLQFQDKPPFDPLSVMLYQLGNHLIVNSRGNEIHMNQSLSASDVLAMRFFYPGKVSINQLDSLYRKWFYETLLENLTRSYKRVSEFTTDCFDLYSSEYCTNHVLGLNRCGLDGITGCDKTCSICNVVSIRPNHPFYDNLDHNEVGGTSVGTKPVVTATETKTAVTATETKTAVTATETKTAVTATETKTAVTATETKPVTATVAKPVAKKFYKKVWFWVVLAIAVCIVIILLYVFLRKKKPTVEVAAPTVEVAAPTV
jgi:hypothetical protein